MLTNKRHTVLYIGMTNDITRRIYEHKNRLVKGFTQRYNVYKLLHVETSPTAYGAIEREKELKGWTRAKKEALINAANPHWEEIVSY